MFCSDFSLSFDMVEISVTLSCFNCFSFIVFCIAWIDVLFGNFDKDLALFKDSCASSYFSMLIRLAALSSQFLTVGFILINSS